MNKDNGLKKFNKWIGLVISVTALLSMFVGVIAGTAIKNQKLEETYQRCLKNEKSIYDLREIMIRIDTNMEFVKEQIEKMEK